MNRSCLHHRCDADHHGASMRSRARVVGCLLAGAALIITGCSSTSAPSRPRSSPQLTMTTATKPSLSPGAPPCGVPIPGRHRYLPSPAAAVNAVLLLGTGPRGIALGAQADGDICQMLPLAERERALGYHVAIFNWNTIGSSDYAADMSRAVRALIADGARRVVVGGFSRGALVALGAASRLGRPVVGVISVSGGPSPEEGFPTIRSLATYPGPILLISSKDDWVFPRGTSAAIAAAHHGPNTLLVVPGNEHALALLQDAPVRQQIYAAVDSFLARVL